MHSAVLQKCLSNLLKLNLSLSLTVFICFVAFFYKFVLEDLMCFLIIKSYKHLRVLQNS